MSPEQKVVERAVGALRATRKEGRPLETGEHTLPLGVVLEVYPVRDGYPELGYHYRVKGTKRWKRL